MRCRNLLAVRPIEGQCHLYEGLRQRGLFARGGIFRDRNRLGLQPAGLLQGAAQHKLDLRVQAAQLDGGPALHGVVDRRVEPQQEWFAFRQKSPLLHFSSSSTM